MELGPYETYEGSPVSKGILQYDMWNKIPSDLWDWTALKNKIASHGVRNSFLVAPMPTASTAQILGNNESFEPYTSNVYNRRVLSGKFQVVNHHLIHELTERGLWDDDMKNTIIAANGSIQGIEEIPADIRGIYKTVWEMSVKNQIQMAADRGAFIDQSQSFKIHVAKPNYGKLTSIHFYAWKMGLKTGMYYLRTKPAAAAIQFTVDKERLGKTVQNGSGKINGNTSTPTSTKNSPNKTNGTLDGTANEDEESERKLAQLVCSLEKKACGGHKLFRSIKHALHFMLLISCF
jgi:ribonucleoside-diphosphate reductase subunit M1